MHLVSVDIKVLINEIMFIDYIPHCLIQIVFKICFENYGIVWKILNEIIHSEFLEKIQNEFLNPDEEIISG
jgi:hypothetical protein